MGAAFDQALRAYLLGQADPRDLADAFDADRAAGAELRPMLALLDRAIAAGKLDPELGPLLRARVPAAVLQAVEGPSAARAPTLPVPPSPGEPEPDLTLIAVPPAVTPAPAPASPTPPPTPPAVDGGVTAFTPPRPATPPAADVGASTRPLQAVVSRPDAPPPPPGATAGDAPTRQRPAVVLPGATPAPPASAETPPPAGGDDITVVFAPHPAAPISGRSFGSPLTGGTGGTGGTSAISGSGVSGGVGGASAISGGTGTGADRTQVRSRSGGGYAGAPVFNDRPLDVGDVLKDRFLLEAKLGEGGMGQVFKALDMRREAARDIDPYVAVKVLSPEFSRHPDAVITLQRETKKVQNLASDHVIRVYDFDQDTTRIPTISFMTMELLEGEPLDRYIKQEVPREGLDYATARPIIAALAEGLGYAHRRGLVHSDFKPGNAFITRKGEVKVLDFGIARIANEEQARRETFDAGGLGARTPAYASPEMFDGAEPDPRDDIFALACVSYELLGGRHPFERKSAQKVREAGLKPLPIKHLSKRQWQALERGLALDRAARTPTCEAFLQGLDGDVQRHGGGSRRGLIIGAAGAGVAIIALVATGPLQNYLNERRVAALREEIAAGDGRAEAALASLAELSDDTRRQVLADDALRDELIRLVLAQADAEVDEAAGRYDFDAAAARLKQALAWYPRDADLVQRSRALEERRDRLLNELNQAFTRALDENLLGPEAGPDGVKGVLERLAGVDPAHPLLKDPRIAPAYAAAAEAALARNDLDLTRDLLAEAATLVPDDPALAEIGGRLRLATERALRDQQVANLVASLEGFQPRTLADFLSRRDDLIRLARLAPDHPRRQALDAALQNALDAALKAAQASRDWQGARALLAEYEPLLTQGWLAERARTLSDAENALRDRFGALEEDIRRQVGGGRFDAAREGLNRLVAEAAPAATIERTRDLIARGWLDSARQHRAARRFDAARQALAQARELSPGAALSEALAREAEDVAQAEQAARQQLAEAERQRLEQTRAQALDAARTRFDSAVTAIQSGGSGASEALAALDDLARLAPTDPLVSSGRERIAGRLAELAQAQVDSGALDAAAASLRDGLRLLPESERLVQAQAQVERARQAARGAEEARRISDTYARLDTRLAKPFSGTDWGRGVYADLRELESRVAAGDPELARRREQLLQAYAAAIDAALAAQRFSDARSQLAEAGRLLPEANLTALRTRIDGAETAFRDDQEKRRVQATIDGLRQDFATRIKANDPEAARRTLAQLGPLLPATDPFLTQQAPRDLIDAYLRLAARDADRKRYDRALATLARGLDAFPDQAELKAKVDEYRREGAFGEIEDALDKGAPDALAGLDRKLRDAQRLFPDEYARRAADWPRDFAKRVNKQAEKDPGGALALLDAGRKLFPDAKELAAITITVQVQPSKFAPRGNDLVAAGKLGEADRVLAQGRKAEGDHPELKALEDAIAQKRDKAEAAHDAYLRAFKRKELDTAKQQLDAALALWVDNTTWLGEQQALQAKPEEQPVAPEVAKPAPGKPAPPGADPCQARLAGQGRRPYGVCTDALNGGGKGPDLVVVPAGGGNGTPFAIGKYEVSYEEMSAFCRSAGCSVKGGPGLPAVGVSARDAERYVQWLSQQSGFSYRVPSAAEWRFAAEAGGLPPADYNCRLSDGTKVLKGQSLLPARTGQSNGWGLVNVLGNAQELVKGGAAMGGAFTDSFSTCSASLSKAADADSTGLRVARALK
ncbi:serine/threonine protein kinase [Plasticicumulans lactativorans]|uniref:Serine/threonine protein kinase n=1 Tax=Plasticicumulans lactativorans TaxID=1133106 RepID=A0A4R2L2T4_9GAMM|nr:protein kinase [Plasticicumulans lactativorans]TCO78086.1 serine/threonine protein kinase [Plasticicumulans lactativorans]